MPYPATHGMRDEMHISLKWLHRLVPRSRFLLLGTQKCLCHPVSRERWRMLSSQFPAETHLAAHPVGVRKMKMLLFSDQCFSPLLTCGSERDNITFKRMSVNVTAVGDFETDPAHVGALFFQTRIICV